MFGVKSVPAVEIKPGMDVVEKDGAFFRVASVEPAGKRIVLGLENVNGYMSAAAAFKVRVSARALVRIAAAE